MKVNARRGAVKNDLSMDASEPYNSKLVYRKCLENCQIHSVAIPYDKTLELFSSENFMEDLFVDISTFTFIIQMVRSSSN